MKMFFSVNRLARIELRESPRFALRIAGPSKALQIQTHLFFLGFQFGTLMTWDLQICISKYIGKCCSQSVADAQHVIILGTGIIYVSQIQIQIKFEDGTQTLSLSSWVMYRQDAFIHHVLRSFSAVKCLGIRHINARNCHIT